jgi:hypothetical protein
MKVRDMLEMYRGAASEPIQAVADEFLALSPSEQREFLFWAFLDVTTHPTRTQHVANAATKPS